jgi:hypothetical protein
MGLNTGGATPNNVVGTTLQPTLRGPGGRIATPKIHPPFAQANRANPNTVVKRIARPLPSGPLLIQATNNVGTEDRVLSLFD